MFEQLPGLLSHTVDDTRGNPVPLARFRGRVLLIVNVATEDGYAAQFAELERVHRRYQGEEFSVLAFPSNDFGGTEPRSDAEIREHLKAALGATSFPLFRKGPVIGAAANPLYKDLAASAGEPDWNFHKYLVGKDAKVIASWPADVSPLSREITGPIETALGEERTLVPAVRRKQG